MPWLLDDPVTETLATRALFTATYGGADFGEIRSTLAAYTAASDPSQTDDERDLAWHTAWTATADRVESIADRSADGGHRVSAREAYLRAATYHRTAAAPLFGPTVGPRLADSSARERGALAKLLPLADPAIEVLDVTLGDVPLDVLLVRSATAGDAPAPTIVCVNGYDSTVGEMLVSHAVAATRRGYHCVLVDGPGQGRTLIEHGLHLRPDWEAVVGPVLDVVSAHPAVDDARLVLNGWSLGGFLAPRAAAFEPRLAALLADPGQWDQREALLPRLPLTDEQKAAFPDVDPSALDPMQEFLDDPSCPRDLRWRLLQRAPLVHGTSTLFDSLAELCRFEVSSVAHQITCPTLITAAEDDPLSQHADQLLAAIGSERKDLVRFTAAEGAGGHCEGEARLLLHQRTYDWLDDVLGAR